MFCLNIRKGTKFLSFLVRFWVSRILKKFFFELFHFLTKQINNSRFWNVTSSSFRSTDVLNHSKALISICKLFLWTNSISASFKTFLDFVFFSHLFPSFIWDTVFVCIVGFFFRSFHHSGIRLLVFLMFSRFYTFFSYWHVVWRTVFKKCTRNRSRRNTSF